MANTREIQSRMKSIKDTMKITSAMYMISSNKLKKAKLSLEHTEPYFYAMQSGMARILRHLPEIEHPFFDQRDEIKPEDRKIGYIVVTADKGLAGSYNHNVIKLAQEYLDKGGQCKLFVVGQLGVQYFAKTGTTVDINFQYTAQDPTINRARNIAEKMIEFYENRELDEIYVIYTKMVNAAQMETEVQKLLPLKKADFGNVPMDIHAEEIAMLPSPDKVISSIGQNYISGFIYGALVESYASEQNARVMAMEGATKSAKDMLRELSITYNRLRQAAITQEITEVISGAKAQKRKKKH